MTRRLLALRGPVGVAVTAASPPPGVPLIAAAVAATVTSAGVTAVLLRSVATWAAEGIPLRLLRVSVLGRCSLLLGGVAAGDGCVDRGYPAFVISAAVHIVGLSRNIDAVGVLGRWFNLLAVRISISVRLVCERTGRAWASAATKRTPAFVHQVVVWQGIK